MTMTFKARFSFIFVVLLVASACSTHYSLLSTHLCYALTDTQIVDRWDAAEKQVRDGTIPRAQAVAEFKFLHEKLIQFFDKMSGRAFLKKELVYPLEGYTSAGQEKYYVATGYDFFTGTKHAGHPATDLFIHDKHQKCLDDRTHKPVNIVSASFGIVVGKNTGWVPGNPIRGGNYLWIYDMASDGLYYYAHMKDISVELGALVRPGDVLGTVGRTGLNAYPKRSPTHLHFMYCKYRADGVPVPQDIYAKLMKAGKRKK
jgi:murein DD-endopeptidase MepM/ murein hydrolase activator NlpD